MLEELIKYEFKNKNLIDEITNINNDLVIIGDSFISNYINNKINNEFVYYDNGIKYYFDMDLLNNLKIKLLSNDYFNDRCVKLHLNDINDRIDIFKALIGGIIVDNSNTEYELIDRLLNIDDSILLNINNSNNYYKLIYEWSKNKYKELPIVNINCDNEYNVSIKIKDINEEFKGSGRSKYLAMINSSKVVYNYLENNNMLLKMTDIVGYPDIDKCINQLQELYVKGFINEPTYKIAMKGSNNGIDVWKCRIVIDGIKESFSSEDTSKKNAKRNCAFEMLKYIIDEK